MLFGNSCVNSVVSLTPSAVILTPDHLVKANFFNLQALTTAFFVPFWASARLKCLCRVLERGQLAGTGLEENEIMSVQMEPLVIEVWGQVNLHLLHENGSLGGVWEFSGWTVEIQRDYLCNTLCIG